MHLVYNFFLKIYYFKCLTNASKTLVNISHKEKHIGFGHWGPGATNLWSPQTLFTFFSAQAMHPWTMIRKVRTFYLFIFLLFFLCFTYPNAYMDIFLFLY